MSVEIRIDDPLSTDGRALIGESDLFIRAIFPPEECFTFSPDELSTPNTRFYIARDNTVPVGCVALVRYDAYSEVKRMFVADSAKGKGIGRKLMQRLEQDAKNTNVSLIRLETSEKLVAAVNLYQSLGYAKRGAYGDYPDCGVSLFMEKSL